MQNLIHQGLVIACEVECDNPQTLGTRLCRGHNAVAHLTHLNWAFSCQFKSTFCILGCTRCTKPAVPSKFRAAAASMMYLPEPSSSSQPLWRRIKNNERIERTEYYSIKSSKIESSCKLERFKSLLSCAATSRLADCLGPLVKQPAAKHLSI